MDFTLDIIEKDVGAVQPPTFPQPTPNATGQPQHKKRTRTSAFKQQRRNNNDASSSLSSTTNAAPPPPKPAPATTDKERIDKENRDMLAAMSAQEIAQERQELLDRLDPSIVQMLLKRANLDDRAHTSASVFDELEEVVVEKKPQDETNTTTTSPRPPNEKKKTTEDDQARKSVRFAAAAVEDDDDDDDQPPSGVQQQTSPQSTTIPPADTPLAANTTHFPHPASLPDLDPSDPDFLDTLHKKYFPTLPADPSKLAWMAPLPTPGSPADRDSPYYPGQATLSVAALRFDFRGRLLAPATSRALPVTRGLHHHAEAPEAAGYTLAELGRYARSAVPAQRCVAFQTLGRLLYRLGRGEFGHGGGGAETDDVARGIWRAAQENRILDTLLEAADVPEGQGHRGSRAYAMEAVWLFEKGGWKEKFQGR